MNHLSDKNVKTSIITNDRICFNCKITNPEGVNFCQGCGNMIFCSNSQENGELSFDSEVKVDDKGPKILGKYSNTPTSDKDSSGIFTSSSSKHHMLLKKDALPERFERKGSQENTTK